MTANSDPKHLNVRNPGFDRNVLSSTGLHLRLAPQGGLREDWWAGLPWWESTWQARVGIKALCARPFLHLVSSDGKHTLIPTQLLYPNALQATDDQRIEEAALSVATYMRQGRELYAAAESAGVTDLSRPILYYYGALAYAKAAITGLFGVIDRKDGESPSQFMTRQTPRTTPIFQIPEMVVRLLLLFYFSMLARYHTAEWQNLLGGANDPEGYIFRKASEEVACHFAKNIASLLPYPNEQDEPVSNEVQPPDPLQEDWLMNWYQFPEEPAES